LASEPGTKAMNVSVWGFRPEEDGQPMWVAVTIDFQSLITRECNNKDYEEWLAHSTDKGDSKRNGCVLGMKETYRRLKKQSVCRNGRNFVVTKKQIPCPCTREDYVWLVLILVSAGAAVIVLLAVFSAVLAVRKQVYRTRMPAYRFSNLRIQDDNNGISADLEWCQQQRHSLPARLRRGKSTSGELYDIFSSFHTLVYY
ncbi:hypothetical protein XENOCAPTIV_014416, partial [Xenoophorus captivus]